MPSDTNSSSAPYGLDVLTIDLIEYKLNDPGTSPNQVSSETIHEPDEEGKAQPGRVVLKDGPDLVTRTVTVQRATASTASPQRGDTVTWDHDRSGTASSWIVSSDPQTGRGQNTMDTFTFDLLLLTYQG